MPAHCSDIRGGISTKLVVAILSFIVDNVLELISCYGLPAQCREIWGGIEQGWGTIPPQIENSVCHNYLFISFQFVFVNCPANVVSIWGGILDNIRRFAYSNTGRNKYPSVVKRGGISFVWIVAELAKNPTKKC